MAVFQAFPLHHALNFMKPKPTVKWTIFFATTTMQPQGGCTCEDARPRERNDKFVLRSHGKKNFCTQTCPRGGSAGQNQRKIVGLEKDTLGKYAVEHQPISGPASQMVFDVCRQNSLPISLCNRVTQYVAHCFFWIVFFFIFVCIFWHSFETSKNCCTIVLTTLHTSLSICCTKCLTSLSRCL